MKHSALAAGLLALAATGTVGCKSASKLAWWKSDKAAEATALAHSAPQLPSEAAKQNDAAGAKASQIAAGAAPAYSAGPSGGAAQYPNTTAPAFNPASTQVAADAPPPAKDAASLGSIALPYDPAAVPAPKISGANTASLAMADRYTAPAGDPAAAPSYGAVPPPTGASGMASLAMSPYGRYSPAPTDVAANVTAVVAADDPAAHSGVSAASSYAVPYGTGAGGAPSMAHGSPAPADAVAAGITPYSSPYGPSHAVATPTSTSPSSAGPSVAAGSPYRPGGTSSYPSTGQPAVQIATRTSDASSATTAPAGTSSPVAAPGAAPTTATPAMPVTPPATRYW